MTDLNELTKMVERSIERALDVVDDDRLRAIPMDVLIAFVAQACTAQIVAAIGAQMEAMHEASKSRKQ